MNCKPGDMAIVVRPASDGKCPPLVGEIVRVKKISWRWSDAWVLEPPMIDPRDGFQIHVPDVDLRPIRDPGDDAQDETLSWLPVPSKTLEQA